MHYLSVLNKENIDINLDADVKFFLIKLLQKFQLEDEIKVSVKALQNEFGITDRGITKSFKALTAVNILIQNNKYGGKGRPCNSYFFAKRFKNKVVEIDVQHQSFIEELLVPDSIKRVKCNKLSLKKHPLGISTRLLLIVMFFYADDKGILSALGVTELSKITGLSIAAVRTNIIKLKKHQYIRCSVGGVTSSLLFNQANSHYHLNISASRFSSCKNSVITVDQVFIEPEAFSIFTYARQITKYKDKEKKTPKNMFSTPMMKKKWPEDKFSKIAKFFNETMASRVANFLQLKMEYYASSLLSDCWDDLENEDWKYKLIDLINNNIYKSIAFTETDKEVEDLFCLFIYDTILFIAENSKKGITTIINSNNIKLSKMKHVIIPQVNYSGHFIHRVIESLYDRTFVGGSISRYYITKRTGFIVNKSELEDFELSGFNLLSEQ